MSAWDVSLKTLKDKVPDLGSNAALAADLDERIKAAESEFASSIVQLILFGDGTTLNASLDQNVGTGACGNLGNGAFKGMVTENVAGNTYTVKVTATTAKIFDSNGGLIYNGKGSASAGIRGSWPLTFQ
ncbi:hypothetical protein MIND_00770400 [Mycena indigotica]|uniref:Uncharacterized protein n=1 Tax=Mycena indigotica TaxID=2126181 RepID=A0A8H6SND3_9AGAR|nr:uncharacterized protein MIND_00770400 [Mycena indigotica]KAF7302040.1 hypothetical protein MIND_00770400 [Mycena indigotica]